MSTLEDFHVFVPAFNEAENLTELSIRCQSLVNRAAHLGVRVHVTVVNDCSTDNSAQVLEGLKNIYPWLSVITHPQNRNLVGVLETFLSQAAMISAKSDHLLGFGLLDGDDSHDPNNFIEMILRLSSGYDVVIASRYQVGSVVIGVRWWRQLLSRGVSVLFQTLGRIKNVRDYSCGFRAYSPFILKELANYRFQYRSFACMAELIMVLAQKGATACEVPFVLRYDRKRGVSKMRFWITIRETIKVLVNVR
jgi:dolichol-phosphate mannosyltransferase